MFCFNKNNLRRKTCIFVLSCFGCSLDKNTLLEFLIKPDSPKFTQILTRPDPRADATREHR